MYKKFCLDCFMQGRLVVMEATGQCPACGCRQSVVQATIDYPGDVIWPWPGKTYQ